MKKVDASTLEAAARRYVGLRRRYWRFWLGIWIMFAVGAAYVAAFGSQDDHMTVGDIPLILPGLGFMICFLGSLVTWNSLMEFRCPQCGKRFILTWGSSWPTSSCKHCGLYLGQSKGDHLLE
jgi:hypothetical protein